MTAATVEAPARYQFKPGPYSSHALLLREFPRQGDGRRFSTSAARAGIWPRSWRQRGFSVTGIDLPGTAHPPGIDFVAADLDRGLPALDGSFDYILCADVLEHLREPEAVVARMPGTAGARRCAHRFAAQQPAMPISAGTC